MQIALIQLNNTLFPTLTVAIPALNEEKYIKSVIDSFRLNNYSNIVEIIVADGGSSDKTVRIVEEISKEDSRVKLIHNPERFQSFALNHMLAVAKGELFLRADAHAIYSEDYVETSIEALIESKSLNAGGAQRYIAETVFEYAVKLSTQSNFGSGGAQYKNNTYSGYADTVFLGCYYTKILKKIGGFATDVGVNEDFEMNYRLSLLQENAVYISSNIKVHYKPRNNFKSLIKQYYRYGISKCLFYKKHHILSFRQVLPITISTILILILALLPVFASSILTELSILAFGLFSILFLYLLIENNSVNPELPKTSIPFYFTPILSILIIITINIAFSAGFISAFLGKKKLN